MDKNLEYGAPKVREDIKETVKNVFDGITLPNNIFT